MPLEIELKIIRLRKEDWDAKQLKSRIETLGGRLFTPRRMLEDTLFRFSEDHQPPQATFTIARQDFTDAERLKGILTYLGVEWNEEESENFIVKKPTVLPKRTVRMRRDGNLLTLNVKEPRVYGVAIDQRREEEVAVTREGALFDLVSACGYALEGRRQKYRTSFMVDDALVELNEGPRVPPWIEIEAPSSEKVFEAVGKLGYTKEDCAAMGDSQYYLNHGWPQDKLYSIFFDTLWRVPRIIPEER